MAERLLEPFPPTEEQADSPDVPVGSAVRASVPHLRLVPPIPTDEQDAADDVDGDLRTMALGSLDFEHGGHLDAVSLAYRTWGQLNAAGDNAVLVLHALTGDSLCAGENGWWGPVIGPGQGFPIDTTRYYVICTNVLGGCQGSTGPGSIDPDTGEPWGMRFPLTTIGDIVAAQRRLVERLGVRRLIAIGGSIGGFQALEWATRHPDLVYAAAPLASSGALDAQGIATHSELGRRAIMADPNWHGGDYARHGVFPEQGLAIARMAAMVTYNGRDNLNQRFGRNAAQRPALYESFGQTFDIEGYLHYHGAALVKRFDANSYLYLTRAMDLYDVGRDGGEAAWLDRIGAEVPVTLAGISSDWLFPPGPIASLGEAMTGLGKDVVYEEIVSPHGHDAFLKDWDRVNEIVAGFMRRAETARERLIRMPAIDGVHRNP
ncbi:MAG: homoserine O-acetyltransferase [Thermomicrobiales bacterium]